MTQGPNKTRGGDFLTPFSYRAHTGEFEPIDERTLGFDRDAFGVEMSGVFKRPVTHEEIDGAMAAIDKFNRARRSEEPAYRARQIKQLKESEAYLAGALEVYRVRTDEVPQDIFNILVDSVTDRRRRLFREGLVDVERAHMRIERYRAERINGADGHVVPAALRSSGAIGIDVVDRMETALLDDLASAMGTNGQLISEMPRSAFVEAVAASISRALDKSKPGAGPRSPTGDERSDAAMRAMRAHQFGRYRVMIGDVTPPLMTPLLRPVPMLK